MNSLLIYSKDYDFIRIWRVFIIFESLFLNKYKNMNSTEKTLPNIMNSLLFYSKDYDFIRICRVFIVIESLFRLNIKTRLITKKLYKT